MAGVSIDFAIERKFNAPFRFQSNELYHPVTISANHLLNGFSAMEDVHGGLPDL